MCGTIWRRSLGSVALLLAWVLPLQAGAVFEVYVSSDGTNPGVPAEIPIEQGGGEPSILLDVYVHNGGGAASGAPCAGTTPGVEVCMWDLNITASGSVQIVGFTEQDPAATVSNPQPTFLRVNGGDPLAGKINPELIGQLEVRATGPGSLNVVGEQWVDNQLNANSAAQGGDLATACAESEPAGQGDDLCDASDPCDVFQNTLPLDDPNGDGIPTECQCGDADQNGFYQFGDAFAIADCASGNPCTLDIGVSDTNNDGFLQFADAFAVANVVGGSPSFALTCPRRPEGTAP